MIEKCPHHHEDEHVTESPAPPPNPYWRSLEELSNTPEFEAMLHREFPAAASLWKESVSRRRFLALMGASMALVGLNGCYHRPTEKILPYVIQPEQLVPGNALQYASAMPLAGYGKGVIVDQQMGRAIKVEGNPKHPSTLGGTDVFMQAAPLALCDPDRSQVPVNRGNVATWSSFENDFRTTVEHFGGPAKVRIRLLTEPVTSPAFFAEIQRLRSTYKNLQWHQWSPFAKDNARTGARSALGRDANVIYDFSKATRILSLDSNFLIEDPGSLRYAAQFIRRRTVRWKPDDLLAHHESARTDNAYTLENPVPSAAEMNRLYVIESTYTVTGAKADHRLAVKPTEVEILARAIAAEIQGSPIPLPPSLEKHAPFIRAVATDLNENRGHSLVIAGDSQPPSVHHLAHIMNAALGNVGQTLSYIEPVEPEPVHCADSLRDLTTSLNNKEVDVLLIVGVNPVFDAPADLNFATALETVPWRAHLSLYLDETSYHCHWHLPESHWLEFWGDIRAHDGTVSIIQPLIAPLYATRSALELLSTVAGESQPSAYMTVKNHWTSIWKTDTETRWENALRSGIIEGTAARTIDIPTNPTAPLPPTTPPTTSDLEINFLPDPTIFDGRFANIGWLQECPKPITKLTWDNAALISPETVISLGLADRKHPERANGQMLEFTVGDRTIRIPVWVQPGQPDNVITVHCGYGRTRIGRVGNNAGFNIYPLRTTAAMHVAPVTVKRIEGTYPLACTQNHQLMHGRDIIKTSTIAEVQNPHEHANAIESAIALEGEATVHGRRVKLSILPEYDYRGYRWGMVIDQTACIGCNACVVACQSENNIPVVGKDQVLMSREMHWLRIDTYFADAGEPEDDPTQRASSAQAMFQPMLCQHCQTAPCELVCPVEATSHSFEGINEMTYNRCVGTRYCSNNCPYKVRRFNFFRYEDPAPSLAIMRNPEVTVRTRGVMEKCTYCIQRINRERTDKKIDWVKSEEQGTPIKMRNALSDHVEPLPAATQLTACQQACPTEAIIFGDMNDANTFVSRLKTAAAIQPIHYGVLTELNTQPRTTYLNRLTNPNPALSRLSSVGATLVSPSSPTPSPGAPPTPSPGTPGEGRGEGLAPSPGTPGRGELRRTGEGQGERRASSATGGTP
jgi:MoCo/4Fe-4S cofactor protein with predicted Tat translocation signal